MKLCKDCRHFRPDPEIPDVLEFAQCHHPDLLRPPRIDPVTGEPDREWLYCESSRMFDINSITNFINRYAFGFKHCGRPGYFWEPLP